jgi:hypothetical protein
MPIIRIRRKIRIRIKKYAAPKIKWHEPLDRKDKASRKPVVFDFTEAEVKVEKIDAKKRKELAEEALQQERRQRRLDYMQQIREEEARPVKVPSKQKPSVVICTGKRLDPKEEKGVQLGWVHKKHYLPMPVTDDAVKVSVFVDKKFEENLYLRVLKVLKSGIIVTKVMDDVFYEARHKLRRFKPLRIKQENILRLVQHARWVDGKHYEGAPPRQKPLLEQTIATAESNGPDTEQTTEGPASAESGAAPATESATEQPAGDNHPDAKPVGENHSEPTGKESAPSVPENPGNSGSAAKLVRSRKPGTRPGRPAPSVRSRTGGKRQESRARPAPARKAPQRKAPAAKPRRNGAKATRSDPAGKVRAPKHRTPSARPAQRRKAVPVRGAKVPARPARNGVRPGGTRKAPGGGK